VCIGQERKLGETCTRNAQAVLVEYIAKSKEKQPLGCENLLPKKKPRTKWIWACGLCFGPAARQKKEKEILGLGDTRPKTKRNGVMVTCALVTLVSVSFQGVGSQVGVTGVNLIG
jgi:hypothetical protein